MFNKFNDTLTILIKAYTQLSHATKTQINVVREYQCRNYNQGIFINEEWWECISPLNSSEINTLEFDTNVEIKQ